MELAGVTEQGPRNRTNVGGVGAPSHKPSKAKRWAGRILSAAVILFLLLDGATKVTRLAPVVETLARAGFSDASVAPIGAVLLVSTVLFTIPRTSVLGALLLTAYLGGATATNVRMGQPCFFPVIVGIVVWASLLLRDQRIPTLLPFMRASRGSRS